MDASLQPHFTARYESFALWPGGPWLPYILAVSSPRAGRGAMVLVFPLKAGGLGQTVIPEHRAPPALPHPGPPCPRTECGRPAPDDCLQLSAQSRPRGHLCPEHFTPSLSGPPKWESQPSFPEQACLLNSVQQGVCVWGGDGPGQNRRGVVFAQPRTRRSPSAVSKGLAAAPRHQAQTPTSTSSADFLLKDAQAGPLCS